MSDTALAEELNQFYVRFDCHDFSEDLSKFREAPEGSKIQISEMDVCRILEGTDQRKSPGPDASAKNCGLFLCDIFSCIFKLSLAQMDVPALWKK